MALLLNHGMTIKDIKRECSDNDDFFLGISMKIKDLTGVCCHLKVPECNLETTVGDDSDRKVDILWTWKRKFRNNATYLALIRAFLKMGNQTLAEFIIEYAKHVLEPPQVRKDSLVTPAKCFPNWETMSESYKEKVENDLLKKGSQVRKAFSSLVLKLCNSFADRGVKPIDVQLIVVNYGVPDGSSRSAFDFGRNDNMSEVFMVISQHSSWFNHQLFSVVVDEIGNQTEKDLLQEYLEKSLVPYLKSCIFEIPSRSFSSCHSSSQKTSLFLKVFNKALLTGLDVKAIQHNLAQLLGLNTSILHFCHYEEGCLELFFSVSTAVFHESIYLEWVPSKESYRIAVDVINL